MLTFQESLDYLYSFVDYSATRLVKYSAQAFDLSRMVALLDRLGNPQRRYPCLHLAGTKGKGSVAAMCASALTVAGYRTGLYTSPHLLDFCERIQVNGALIPHAALISIVERLKELAPQIPGLTTFELTTALAFEHFARETVDVAVVEVGLGGRLDATNVVTPLVSVITSISYDHMDLLGHSLAQIAGEKAGIIKPDVPVVSAPQQPEALEVLARAAADHRAPFTVVGRDWEYRLLSRSLDGQDFEVWPANVDGLEDGRPTRLEIPLLGAHQVENAATAYAVLTVLRGRGLTVSREATRAGFRAVRWPGRFEILNRRPFVVVDGAHNRDSARRLALALDDYFPSPPPRRIILIFGASSDKDVAGMLDELLPRVAHVIISQAGHPRALEPDELAALAVSRAGEAAVEVRAPVVAALARAVELASSDDVILACGSLFIVAEVQAAHAELLARR